MNHLCLNSGKTTALWEIINVKIFTKGAGGGICRLCLRALCNFFHGTQCTLPPLSSSTAPSMPPAPAPSPTQEGNKPNETTQVEWDCWGKVTQQITMEKGRWQSWKRSTTESRRVLKPAVYDMLWNVFMAAKLCRVGHSWSHICSA